MSCVTWLPKSMIRMRSSVMFRLRIGLRWGWKFDVRERPLDLSRFGAGGAARTELLEEDCRCIAISRLDVEAREAAKRGGKHRIDLEGDDIIFAGELRIAGRLVHGGQFGKGIRIGGVGND